jgi:hypothetical protein
MYLVGAFDNPEDIRRVALERPPFGPGYDEAALQDVVRLEVWGTSADDVGDAASGRVLRAGLAEKTTGLFPEIGGKQRHQRHRAQKLGARATPCLSCATEQICSRARGAEISRPPSGSNTRRPVWGSASVPTIDSISGSLTIPVKPSLQRSK